MVGHGKHWVPKSTPRSGFTFLSRLGGKKIGPTTASLTLTTFLQLSLCSIRRPARSSAPLYLWSGGG